MHTRKTNLLPLVLLPVIPFLCFELWSASKAPVPEGVVYGSRWAG